VTPGELVEAVEAAGFRVRVRADGTPELRKVGTGACLPTDLLEQLKARRHEVVHYLTACEACDRAVASDEDRARLAQVNPFCGLTECPYRAQRKR
jgi:hypothetical protein